MKRFSEFKFQKRINEQEVALEAEKVAATETDKPAETQQVEEKSVGDFPKFVSKLFESRQKAHVYHLQVKGDEGSYAAHVALNAYYDEVLGFIDEMIEVHQGQYGIIEKYDEINTDNTTSVDKLVYFEELVKEVRETRKCIATEDTHLHNIVDEVVALLYKTIYKLKYNK